MTTFEPQNWDDVKPGDIIAWTESKWSHRLGKNTERPRRLLVRWVADRTKYQSESVRSVWGVLITKVNQPHRGLNAYPLTDANHVSTGELGHVITLQLNRITIERGAYVRQYVAAEPESAPAAPPAVKLSPAMVAGLKKFFSGYTAIGTAASWQLGRSGTTVALINKETITTSKFIDGQRLHQITAAGCEAIGRSMDEVVAWARGAALIEHIERGHDPANIVHNLDELDRGTGDTALDRHPAWWLAGRAVRDAAIRITDVAQAHEQALREYWERGSVDGDLEGDEYAYNLMDGITPQPRFPKGTPEYDAYRAELKTELNKFAKGEPPYEYKWFDNLMNSGATNASTELISETPEFEPRTATFEQLVRRLFAQAFASGVAINTGESGQQANLRAHAAQNELLRRASQITDEYLGASLELQPGLGRATNVMDGLT